MKIGIWYFTLSVLLITPNWLYADSRFECLNQYLNKDSLTRKLDPTFIEKYISLTNPKYSWKVVSDQVRIENQGNRGFCHIYSLKSELSRDYKVKAGVDPEVSLHYIGYQFWKERALQTALKPFASLEVQEGGWYVNTFKFIKSVGVMTETQWKSIGGRMDMELTEGNLLKTEQLKKVIYDSHNDLARVIALLVPEALNESAKAALNIDLNLDLSKPSDRSKYYLKLFADDNNIQNFRKWILAKENEVKMGNTKLTQTELNLLMEVSKGNLGRVTKEIIGSIVGKMQADIRNNVEVFFNQMFFNSKAPPKALNLAANIEQGLLMFPEFQHPTVQLDVDRSMRKGPVQFQGFEDNHYVFSTTVSGVKEVIKDQIDNGHTVWLAYDHHSYYVDGKTGAMTISEMYSTPQRPYILRDEREEKNMYYGGHAVQVIGYVKDDNGRPVAFIIQNSWGESFGTKGLEIMDESYFGAYVFGFTTRDKTGKLINTVNEVLNSSDPDDVKLRKLRMMPAEVAKLLN